jgi:hypothetical protein
MSPDQLNDLRQRVLRNDPVTSEELNAAIDSIRGTRVKNNEAAATKVSTPKAVKAGARLSGIDLAAIIAGALKKPAV